MSYKIIFVLSSLMIENWNKWILSSSFFMNIWRKKYTWSSRIILSKAIKYVDLLKLFMSLNNHLECDIILSSFFLKNAILYLSTSISVCSSTSMSSSQFMWMIYFLSNLINLKWNWLNKFLIIALKWLILTFVIIISIWILNAIVLYAFYISLRKNIWKKCWKIIICESVILSIYSWILMCVWKYCRRITSL